MFFARCSPVFVVASYLRAFLAPWEVDDERFSSDTADGSVTQTQTHTQSCSLVTHTFSLNTLNYFSLESIVSQLVGPDPKVGRRR